MEINMMTLARIIFRELVIMRALRIKILIIQKNHQIKGSAAQKVKNHKK
jgi:hypothetical protein